MNTGDEKPPRCTYHQAELLSVEVARVNLAVTSLQQQALQRGAARGTRARRREGTGRTTLATKAILRGDEALLSNYTDKQHV